MLWRRRCISLLQSRRRLLPPSSSIHDLPSRPQPTAVDDSEPETCQFRRQSKLTLTPRAVQSTLSSCPSDLIALRFFLWCAAQPNYFHDRAAFHRMVDVAARLTDRYKSVSGVVGELARVGYVIKAQTFLILMRIYWAGGLYELVLEAFEQMGRFRFTGSTFARNMVMDVLFKIGRPDLALDFLRQTQVPNFLTFNIALCNLCRMNDFLNAHELMRSMLKSGFYPSEDAFEMLLTSFRTVGRLLEASQVLSLMVTLGISISVNTWSILIDGYCSLGRFDMAEFLLRKMEQTGCSPNVVTYTTLIKGYLESGMVSEAFRLLRAMDLKGIGPDLVLCNVLIDCLSRNALYDHALRIFLKMPTWKVAPDSYTFSSLLSTIIHSRRFSHLPRLIREFDIEADLVVYNSLLSYFCKAGFPSEAVELYNDMVDKGLAVDNYTFAGLLYGLCGARKIDKAVNVYHGIVLHYPSLDAHVHTTIVHGLIEAGEYHEAIGLFKKAMIENYALDAVSYTIAIHGLLLGGRSSEASALFNKMKEIGLYPNAHTYNVMIDGFCKEKDGEMVIRILKEMIDARIPLRHDSFLRVINFLSRSCYGNSASGLVVEVTDTRLLPSSTTSFSHGYSEGVHLSDMYSSYLGNSSENSSSSDTSCSEDIGDVAASLG
ncbi:putative pentatricopeptide repeat-containing protein At1g16830 [Punica granatum]|uniref:Uncharacterized protein n=2 Tax=Punica granatum TaxID=22663 RepID=A0A218WAY3_PUNGR|nr:putative pentatricopeptide repeat-containing protein At1g16830 [Punica granatum]XP_031386803.1 putative pentatricopeptide repeat-containing protein At1g16830 [Punica granatum]OWM69500.1 hypothetical protein CDL15_Pgr013961 [Punica granatum]PKI38178.1 hypothetical protein CRG98_041431 [Punica granatum]